MPDVEEVREIVRRRYAAAAAGGAINCHTDGEDEDVFGGVLYCDDETDGIPASAMEASLGCGVPTAVADLHPGEVVLDLGSGAGADVLISAQRVVPSGRVIGVDMTPEMVGLARENAAKTGVTNVEFLEGYLEALPLESGSVDVIISNCVVNLAADKRIVLQEALRVLRPGGRIAVSDVIADSDLDDSAKQVLATSTGCVVGALTACEYRSLLFEAGFRQISITESHRVHPHGASGIVRAVKPVAV